MPAERYARNFPMLTAAEQYQLHDASVAVVGCGGLGGYLLEMLARIGIGRLLLFDDDVFEASNLNRQLLALPDKLGQSKAEAARLRVEAIDPDIVVEAHSLRVTAANGSEYLHGCDLVLDAVDSIQSRRDLVQVCQQLGVPFIHGAIAGWYGQVSVIFPGDTILDKVYRGKKTQGMEEHLGNPAFTPALTAAIQVGEAVKVLLGKGELLRQRVLFIDMLHHEYEVVELGDTPDRDGSSR